MDRDYGIGSNFWKFYLIRSGFTLGEAVSLVKVLRLFRLERSFLVFRVWTQQGPEWTSTHQCTNVDGWCTDRMLFSIPVPSQVDVLCFPVLSPFSAMISVFFLQLYFLPAPTRFYLCMYLFIFLLKLFPPSHLLPPAVPHQPTHLYIWIKSRLFPIYLLTYKFKMCYSHPHPPTHPTTDLLTNTLSRYLPNLTYMATPTFMVASAIDPQWSTTMIKE